MRVAQETHTYTKRTNQSQASKQGAAGIKASLTGSGKRKRRAFAYFEMDR